MKQNLKLFVAVCLILFAGIAYSAVEGKPRKMQTIPTGMWGGQSIRIEVAGNSAKVEYDCANGRIAGPLKLDSKGKFSLMGTHTREVGPIRVDAPRDGRPARFTGWTDGNKMTLTVTLTENNQDLGTFTLERGRE